MRVEDNSPGVRKEAAIALEKIDAQERLGG